MTAPTASEMIKRALHLIHVQWPSEFGPFGVVEVTQDELGAIVPEECGSRAQGFVEACMNEAATSITPDIPAKAEVIIEKVGQISEVSMAYGDIAKELVRAWDNKHILEDLPRPYDSALIEDIAVALKNERDECASVVGGWLIDRLYGAAPREVLETLYVIRDEISLRGNNGAADLSIL